MQHSSLQFVIPHHAFCRRTLTKILAGRAAYSRTFRSRRSKTHGLHARSTQQSHRASTNGRLWHPHPSRADCVKTRLKSPILLDRDLIYVIHVGEENGPLAGAVTMAQRKPAIPGDIGWALLEEYMGKGYATEAAKEFLRFLREDFGLKEIITWPEEANIQSNRVAEKLGL
jgi:RimJ/RimL family protein N-acetyltransferase